MKNLIAGILASLLFLQNVKSQHSSIATSKWPAVYTGLENRISIVVEGVPCNELIVSMTNGLIKRDTGCDYIITPDSAHYETKLVFKQIKGADTIEVGHDYLTSEWHPWIIASISMAHSPVNISGIGFLCG